MPDCRLHAVPHDATKCWQVREAEQRVRAYLKAWLAYVLEPIAPPKPKAKVSGKRHGNLGVRSRGVRKECA